MLALGQYHCKLLYTYPLPKHRLSPSIGYPRLYFDRHVYITYAVQNGIHPFDHRLFQPSLCFFRLLYIAFNDYLIMANEDRHGPGRLIPTLPQKRQCELQAVRSRTLDWVFRRSVSLSTLLHCQARCSRSCHFFRPG
jgi:hypothetical protein